MRGRVSVLLIASVLLLALGGCGKRSDVSAPEGSEADWGKAQQYPLPEHALEPDMNEGFGNPKGVPK